MASTQPNHSMNDDKNKKPLSWSKAIELVQLKERTCKTFIPQEIDRERCVCNNPQHKKDKPKSNKVWNWKKHTETKRTDCYGLLLRTNSPFLRCEMKTTPDQLCLVLLGVWGMSIPRLIMRMIGDATSTLSIKLEKEILRGISDAADASNAWIITSGYEEEKIPKLIGEIVYKSRVKTANLNFNAIAVGKWGNIQDCRKIEKSDDDNTNDVPVGQSTLEPNHTHYIFFDDGTYNSADNGGFTSNLAREISRGAERRIPLVTILVGGNLHVLKSIWKDLKQQVSVVIVDQSGPLANILCKYLKKTTNISKANINQKQAEYTNDDQTTSDDETDTDDDQITKDDENDIDDILMLENYSAQADAEKSYHSPQCTLKKALQPLAKWRLDIYRDLRKLYDSIRQEVHGTAGNNLLAEEFLSVDEKKTLAEYIFWFANCLNTPLRDQIHIFELNSSIFLKNTIYNATVQAMKNISKDGNTRTMTTNDEIRLALHWGIASTTGDQLLTNTMDSNGSKINDQYQVLLLDALSKNQQIFVHNFVQLDIDLFTLFTPDDSNAWSETNWSDKKDYLRELYSAKKRKNTDQLYLLDRIDKKISFGKEDDLNSILKIVVGDFMSPLYKRSTEEKRSKVDLKNKKFEPHECDEEIYRDIFLWCVLTYRLAMAKIILGQMKTRICSALIASKILKSLARYAPDHVSKDGINSEADVFETYAIEFVSCSYSYNKQQACELIMRRVDIYGGVTCLQMAIAANTKKFLYEDACQYLLTNIWYDKIDPVREKTRLVINILTLGISQLLISIYEKCCSNTRQAKQEPDTEAPPQKHEKRRLEKYGIDYSDDYGIDEPLYRQFFQFHNRPVVKYFYTCFGYILFLLFFSYFMLFAFDPRSDSTPDIHWTEILTIIIVTTMFFEEVRQFCFQDDQSWKSKILTYFDVDNRVSNLCLVLPAYVLFYVGLILRFVLTDDIDFSAARIVMAYDLELWFIRAVLFVAISEDLGPKLAMIRKMTNDLLLFIFIIVVVIFGYGVASRSMTAYGTFDFDGRQFFHNVVYPVYYFVLGSFDNELSQLDTTPDASTNIATQVMLAFHMLFVNILLLNLLIALFSNTVTDVQTHANHIWAYDRCALIRDYYDRPALFPPFTFLVSIVQFCQWCWRGCKTDQQNLPCFKMVPTNPDLDKEWSEFERFSTNDYIRQLLDAQINATTDTNTAEDATDETKRLQSDVNQLKQEVINSRIDTTIKLSSMEDAVSILQDRVEQIDSDFDKVSTQMMASLDWIMKAMVRVKMDKDPPLRERNPKKSESDPSSSQQPESVRQRRRTSTVTSFSHPKSNQNPATTNDALQESDDENDT